MDTRLAEVRERKGMKQAELARRINLSRGQVANLESGTRKMDLEVLRRCARALQCSVIDLLLPEDAPDMPSADELQMLKTLRSTEGFDPRGILVAARGVIALAHTVQDAAMVPRELEGEPSLVRKLSERWHHMDDQKRRKFIDFLDDVQELSAH